MDPAVSVLERLGLTGYEAKTYVTLVGLGPAHAADIADAADVPRTRIYSVLAELEDEGWVRSGSGRPKTFQAERPKDRIGALRDGLIDEVDQAIPALEAQFEEEATRFGGPIWLLDTAQAVARRTLEMVRSAREELLMATMFPLPCDGDALETALGGAIDRGVGVRVVAPDRERAAGYLSLGAHVRTAWVPPRFLFMDGRQALLAYRMEASSDQGEVRGVWIPAPEFVEHIAPVQEAIWGMGEPLELE